MIGSFSGQRSVVSGQCNWPLTTSFVCRKNRLVLHVDVIDDADDGGIDGQFFRFRREPGAGALHDQDHFPLAGADGIDADEGPPGAHEPILLAWLDPQGFDGEQLSAHHGFEFLRGNHAAGDFGQKHVQVSFQQGAYAPRSPVNNSLAWRATISSSLVGIIHNCTRLAGASIRLSPRARRFLSRSRSMSNQSSLAQIISRKVAEFSPMPPVKTMAF